MILKEKFPCNSEKISNLRPRQVVSHDFRGDLLINYTEFGDLVSVMSQNLELFEPLFTDLFRTLEECGAQEILKKIDNGCAVRMPLIEFRDRD